MSERALLNRIHGETEALRAATTRRTRLATVDYVRRGDDPRTTTMHFGTYNRSLGPFVSSVTAPTLTGTVKGEVVSVSSRSAVIRWPSPSVAGEIVASRMPLHLRYAEGDIIFTSILQSLEKAQQELSEGEVRSSLRLWRRVHLSRPLPSLETSLMAGLSAMRAVQSQVEAARLFLTKSQSVIWGPPGTGKTAVLGAIAAAAETVGWRVAIVCPSNAAALNAFQSVERGRANLGLGASSTALLVGRRFYEWHPSLYAGLGNKLVTKGVPVGEIAPPSHQWEVQQPSPNPPLPRILVCTLATLLLGSHADLLHLPTISALLIDEASTLTEGEALALSDRVPAEARLVLAGDDKQLSPHNETDCVVHGILETLSLWDAQPLERTMLSVSHRLPNPCVDLLSPAFYRGRLVAARDLAADATFASRLLAAPSVSGEGGGPMAHLPRLLMTQRLLWLHTPGVQMRTVERSYKNEEEAKAAAEAAAVFLRATSSVPGLRVNVVTVYEAQRLAIAQRLKDLGGSCTPTPTTVANVDSLQGMESDVVIVSLVRVPRDGGGSGSGSGGSMGFLADNRRANVALSRAKHGVVIVGDLKAWLMAREESVLHAAAAFALDKGRAVALPGVEGGGGGGGGVQQQQQQQEMGMDDSDMPDLPLFTAAGNISSGSGSGGSGGGFTLLKATREEPWWEPKELPSLVPGGRVSGTAPNTAPNTRRGSLSGALATAAAARAAAEAAPPIGVSLSLVSARLEDELRGGLEGRRGRYGGGVEEEEEEEGEGEEEEGGRGRRGGGGMVAGTTARPNRRRQRRAAGRAENIRVQGRQQRVVQTQSAQSGGGGGARIRSVRSAGEFYGGHKALAARIGQRNSLSITVHSPRPQPPRAGRRGRGGGLPRANRGLGGGGRVVRIVPRINPARTRF